jgi:hypothetical protein
MLIYILALIGLGAGFDQLIKNNSVLGVCAVLICTAAILVNALV